MCTTVRANSSFPMETGRGCSIVMLYTSRAQHEKPNFMPTDSEPADVGFVYQDVEIKATEMCTDKDYCAIILNLRRCWSPST